MTSYYAGQAAASAIQRYGLYAGAAIVVGVVVGWLGVRYARRRVEQRGPWLQLVAINGKSDGGGSAENKPKPLPSFATGCREK